VLGFSAGFNELMRQREAARENADPEFKVQDEQNDGGELVLFNDGQPAEAAAIEATAIELSKPRKERTNAGDRKRMKAKDAKLVAHETRIAKAGRESRLAKVNEKRQLPNFVHGLVSGGMFGSSMFGSAAEVVGGSASAGTGIGAALLGGGSGSVLDRMVETSASDGILALVSNIGKFIVASGAGADDDRLLKLIGSIGPRASEAAHS
jgi:F0F1-type ATP synthase assembly protein I